MSNETFNGDIYVDLDSLFDTRYPVLYGLNPNIANRISNNDYYNMRSLDQFENISYNVFKSFYRNRNKNILKLALPTNIFNLVGEYIVESNTTGIIRSKTTPTTLFINIYPYNLNTQEIEMLKLILREKIPVLFTLKIISIPNRELTPDWLEQNVSTIIKYDTMEWIELHMALNTLIRKPIINTTFVAPALIKSNVDINKLDKDIFKNTTISLSTILKILFIKVRYFNMINEEKKE